MSDDFKGVFESPSWAEVLIVVAIAVAARLYYAYYKLRQRLRGRG